MQSMVQSWSTVRFSFKVQRQDKWHVLIKTFAESNVASSQRLSLPLCFVHAEPLHLDIEDSWQE